MLIYLPTVSNGQANPKNFSGDIIPGQYIVVMKRNALSQARVAAGLTYARRQQLMREDVSTLLSRNRVQNQKITQVYESAIRGFTVKNLSKSELEQLRTDSEIAYILPDQMTYLDEGVKTSHSAKVTLPVVNSCDNYVSINNGTPITNVTTADFGAQAFSLTAEAVLVNDGSGVTTDACSPIQNDVSGKIAVIDRGGGCTFANKVDQAIAAGAIGALILNNSATPVNGMTGSLSSGTSIPVMLISQADGSNLKTQLGSGTVTITMKRVPNSIEQCTPWGITRVGGGQTVAGKRAWIIDSGIDLTHEDLNVNSTLAKSFVGTSANDENGHGSHVAGIIAALDNDKGVIGVAAGAEVVPVRVFGASGGSPTSIIVAGINYVAGLAASSDVANLSLGGRTNQAYYDAIIGLSQKCSVVISAGNDAINTMLKSPANINGSRIYTVSAMDNTDNFASFSNYGNQFVDFCAPGVNVSSCYKNGGYAILSGTSMAAPHVSGLILRGGISSYSRVNNDPDGQPDRIAELYDASKETDQDGDKYTVSQGDFDDNDNTVYPGAAELCDNKDNDCDGMIDEGNVCCPAGNTGVLYVNVNASGTNNGLSWTNAYTSLSAALADARKCSQITQIWVAKGTYYPTTDELGLTTTTTRFKTFGIREGLAIYGGFAGTEGSLNERNIQNNPTILSGDLQNNSTTTDNAYHVVLNYVPLNVTTPVAATLSGFTITAGNANFNGVLYPFNQGGGVFSYGPISIDNTLFTNNLTNSSGGGLYIDRSGGSSTITDTRFQQNRATGGAGFYIETATASITSSTIASNTATSGGGGVFVTNATTQFSKTQFLNNVSKNGSTGSGGGFQSYLSSQSTFSQCLFFGNQAGGTSDDGGGAVMVYSGDVTLINTDIVGNSAATAGGAIVVLSSVDQESSVTIPGSVTVLNSIIWGNTQSGSSFVATSPGTASITFSLLQDASCPPTVTCAPSGILYNANPLFTNEGSGDLTLTTCSPAINAGNPASTTGTIGSTDLAGNNRIAGNIIDLGAYELQATPRVAITGQPVASSSVCVGGAITASVSVSGTVTGYQWYKDSPSGPVAVSGQSTSALSLSNIQTTDVGTYSLVVSGSCNSVTSAAFSLTVNTLPANIGLVFSQTAITCTSPSLVFSATATGTGNSYSLSNGQSGLSGSFTVSSANTYTLSVASPAGCVASTTVAIGSDNANPSLSINAATTVLTCDSPVILLTGVSSATALLWSTNATSTTISASMARQYSLTATGQNGCKATTSVTITGSTTGVGPVSAQVSGIITPGSPTAVITAISTGASGFLISGPGTATSNSTGIFMVSAPGTYQITASSGLSASCSAATSVVVKAGQPPVIISYPATLTLNNSGQTIIPVIGQGIVFQLTGPGNYVYSTVFRQDGQHQATARNIILPGSYMLTVTGSDGSQVQAIITVVAPASRIVLDTPGN
nr:S8 family serine peptidase [uncultured Arsenicibacter sp.]